MTFNEYQELAHRTAGKNSCLEMCALGLAGEAGEFADYVKKIIYHNHPIDIEKLAEELGDILWYIAEACHQCCLVLDDIAITNIKKLQERYPDGFSSERSMNRKELPNTIPCSVCGATGWHSFSCIKKGY